MNRHLWIACIWELKWISKCKLCYSSVWPLHTEGIWINYLPNVQNFHIWQMGLNYLYIFMFYGWSFVTLNLQLKVLTTHHLELPSTPKGKIKRIVKPVVWLLELNSNSKNIQKCPKMSKNVQKRPKSQNLLKYFKTWRNQAKKAFCPEEGKGQSNF